MYDTFGSSCACNVTVRKNASLVYNDAYMARALVPAFMHEAVSLVDEYSLARAKRMAHSSNMDLDGYAVFFFFIFFSVFACSRQAHGAFEQHGFRQVHGLLALLVESANLLTPAEVLQPATREPDAPTWVGWHLARRGTQFTRFTGTKVQILTQMALLGGERQTEKR